MIHIPAEILLAIGLLLDRHSLVACLQVSRDWHLALLPLVWSTITKNVWICRSFWFIKYWRLGFNNSFLGVDNLRLHDARVRCYLGHVRSLTWHNNRALMIDRHPGLPDQLCIPQLILILENTHNLVRCSLVMMDHGILYSNLLSLLRSLYIMPSLEVLEIDLPSRGPAVPIDNYLPLFSKLLELKIGGTWYGGADTLGPLLTEYTPLRLQTLTIDRIETSFIHYCPDLKTLTFSPFVHSFGVPMHDLVRETIVQQLKRSSKLETITYVEIGNSLQFSFKIQKNAMGLRCWEVTPKLSGMPLWRLDEIMKLFSNLRAPEIQRSLHFTPQDSLLGLQYQL